GSELEIAALEIAVERNLAGGRRRHRLCQRQGTELALDVVGNRNDGPIPAGTRLVEAQIAKVRSADQIAVLVHTDRTDQVEQVRRKQALEAPLARLAEKRGNDR